MKQKLSNVFLAFLIIGGVSAFAYRQSQPAPKTYTVTLPLEKWQGILTAVDSTNKLILDSDIPTKKSVYATSALSFLLQSIQFQVGQQLQAEQKADSLNKKPSKP